MIPGSRNTTGCGPAEGLTTTARAIGATGATSGRNPASTEACPFSASTSRAALSAFWK